MLTGILAVVVTIVVVEGSYRFVRLYRGKDRLDPAVEAEVRAYESLVHDAR